MSTSIHPNPRNTKTAQRRKNNHQKNKSIRSNLYKEHCGTSGWDRNVSTWHDTIKALSRGSIG